MTGMKEKGSNSLPPVTLTQDERGHLDRLYMRDGAWTPQEATAAVGQARMLEFVRQGVLGRYDTDIGPLLLLMAPGRAMVFGITGKAQSIAKLIDHAYVRLCLESLGWTRTEPGETRENLAQYDTTGRLMEVRTPHGLVLVGGSIRAAAMSRQNIDLIASRLRSTALFHNFDVILFTRNTRKGHKRALKESAFLVLKTMLPKSPAYPEVQRVRRVPHPTVPVDDAPYLAGMAWRTDPQYASLPDLTKQILQMNRQDRVDHALRSMECDGVLSNGQLHRYYGLRVEDLPDRPYIRTIVRPTHSDFRLEAYVTFVVPTRTMSKLDDHALAHRAGTGEMRHLMGVSSDPRYWKAERRETLRFEEPDAYHYDENGQVHAVEFDNGTYTARVVDDKLTTFTDRGFSEIHWGVTSDKRYRNLTESVRDRLSSDVLLCRWWTEQRLQ